MKLKGINITNLAAYRNYFTLEEVWETIDNGVLLRFQKDLVRQEEKTGRGEAIQPGESVARVIVRLLEACEARSGLPDVISDIFVNGEWDLERMEGKLEPISSRSRDHSGNCFYSRNDQGIRKFINRKGIAWTDRKAVLFCLFLLGFLQVRPQEEISEQDFAFIGKKLDCVPDQEEYAAGKETDMRIYPYGSGFLFLKQGKILDEKNRPVSPMEEKIACFAYTEDLGMIAFTEQGEASACMGPTVRYEIGERKKEAGAEKEKVIMAAACANIYLLLLENGNILTNVLDSLGGWQDIRWIGAGLNSITAVTGNRRSLLELGSDIRLQEFSDVRAAYTWSGDGMKKYAVLKESGVLIMDDGGMAENVDAAYIDGRGYLYAAGAEILARRFGGMEKRIYKMPPDYRIAALSRHNDVVYGRGVSGTGKEFHVIQKEDDCQF